MATPGAESDWVSKIKFMRDNGVETAKWDASNALIECHLGPDPSARSSNEPMPDTRPDRRTLLTGHASQLVPRGE